VHALESSPQPASPSVKVNDIPMRRRDVIRCPRVTACRISALPCLRTPAPRRPVGFRVLTLPSPRSHRVAFDHGNIRLEGQSTDLIRPLLLECDLRPTNAPLLRDFTFSS
jgi:hypothetical protein